MYYRIERTFLTNHQGKYESTHDTKPYLVPGPSAAGAALAFIVRDHGTLVGDVTSLPGDKATATAMFDGRVYVIFAERGSDAIRTDEVIRIKPGAN